MSLVTYQYVLCSATRRLNIRNQKIIGRVSNRSIPGTFSKSIRCRLCPSTLTVQFRCPSIKVSNFTPIAQLLCHGGSRFHMLGCIPRPSLVKDDWVQKRNKKNKTYRKKIWWETKYNEQDTRRASLVLLKLSQMLFLLAHTFLRA